MRQIFAVDDMIDGFKKIQTDWCAVFAVLKSEDKLVRVFAGFCYMFP
jgi:hypothetical protein